MLQEVSTAESGATAVLTAGCCTFSVWPNAANPVPRTAPRIDDDGGIAAYGFLVMGGPNGLMLASVSVVSNDISRTRE